MRQLCKRMDKQTGFTLIELIVVIAILGILSVAAVPRFVDVSSDGREASLTALYANFEVGLSLVKVKQQFIESRLDSHDTRQYWIDMNNNGVVDGDASRDQWSLDNRDGTDILAFTNGEIDNYQVHKLVRSIDDIDWEIPNNAEVNLGYDLDDDGIIADDQCYINYNQMLGFTLQIANC